MDDFELSIPSSISNAIKMQSARPHLVDVVFLSCDTSLELKIEGLHILNFSELIFARPDNLCRLLNNDNSNLYLVNKSVFKVSLTGCASNANAAAEPH